MSNILLNNNNKKNIFKIVRFFICWSDFISHFATLIVNFKTSFNSLIHCSCIPKQPYQSYEKKKKHPKQFKDWVKDKGSQMGKKLIIEDLNYE